ncbi:MAG: DNA ligase, partial [Methylococcales bacterium]|nr:DNA ligase [Methylococcales bacterium]
MLKPEQRILLVDARLAEVFGETQLMALAAQPNRIAALSDTKLEQFARIANTLYRGGQPLISDADYDCYVIGELQQRLPRHSFLAEVEPEPAWSEKTVILPERMLSTDKAYDFSSVRQWAVRIEKAAIGLAKAFAELEFKVTPKLD